MFKETEIQVGNKQRCLSIFRNKSISAYWFACHAALPLFFRTDWLFHLWSNFKDDILKVTGNISLYSDIADVVNSPFTNVVGIEVFEFDNEIRDYLLYDLQQKFGKNYIEQLASFLFQYTQNVNLTDLEKDAHQSTAWSIVYPQQAATELGNAFSRAIENRDEVEQDRLHFVLEAITSPFTNDVKESFKHLAEITRNNKDRNFEGILNSFPEITFNKPHTNAISFKIPKRLTKLVGKNNNQEIDVVQKLNEILQNFNLHVRFYSVELSEIMLTDEFKRISYSKDEYGNITGIRINNLDLGKIVDQTFKALDWKYLTHLNLINCNIDNISFIRLQLINNLAYLNLTSNQISDLSPISGLTKLTDLYLKNNHIKDITSLSVLMKLILLDLSGNEITDLYPLTKLTELTHLNLAGNRDYQTNYTEDFSFFPPKIDYKPLSGLNQLISLNLNDNDLIDISFVKSLTSLNALTLAGNRITDISPLKNLKSLLRLDLQNNKIKELSAWICDFEMDFYWGGNNDHGILLNDNPIESPPVEIVKQGKQAIKNWLNRQNNVESEDNSGNQPLYSIKSFWDDEILYRGFNQNFLLDDIVKESVPLPILNEKQIAYLAPVEYRNKSTLDYLNYSVQLSSSRKFPIFTASNIDGRLFKKTERKVIWRKDPRAREYQWGEELYRARKSGFDKGRITKGQDVQWGETLILAQKAVESTFFYTNTVPQHKLLNRLSPWKDLVDYILHSETRKKSLKICVFAGPVLSENDPSFVIPVNGETVLLPVLFWKVVIYPKEDGKLYRAGFMVNQEKFLIEDGIIAKSEHGTKADNHDTYKEINVGEAYQVSISLIESITGLKMPAAIDSYKDDIAIKPVK